MSEPKIIMVGSFPPPYGGVAVWNERINKQLKRQVGQNYSSYSWNKKSFLEHKNRGSFNFLGFMDLFFKFFSLIINKIIEPIDFLRILKNFKQINAILKWVCKHKDSNIVFYSQHTAFNSLYLLLMSKFINKSRLVIHEHGSGIIEFYQKRPKLVKYLLENSDAIIVTTLYMKELCKAGGAAEEKIHIIPCGIEKIQTDKPQKGKMVLFCGSLSEVKDPGTLIKSIPLVLGTLPDYRFVFVGEGPLRNDLEQMVADYNIKDSVTFTGQLTNEEAYKYFKQAKVFVLPSVREPFGIVLIEAMSCYTPCIAANVGGMPEIVDENCGLTFTAGNHEDLAGKIINLCRDDDLYERYAEASYNKSKNYLMASVGKRIIKVLQAGEFFE